MCVWSLRYPACNAHAPYCRVCSPWRYNIFPPFSRTRQNFRWGKKKLLNTKCVFWFSLQSLSKIILILRITEGDVNKKLYLCSCKVPRYSCRILMNLGQIFEKYPNIKFRKNPSIGGPSCYTRTDGREGGPEVKWRRDFTAQPTLHKLTGWTADDDGIRCLRNIGTHLRNYLFSHFTRQLVSHDCFKGYSAR